MLKQKFCEIAQRNNFTIYLWNERQMSTLDSYQYSNNTTILCIWAWERCMWYLWKWLHKRMKKKKWVLNWCSIFPEKKLATTQDRQTLQNFDEKQYCKYWILRLVVCTRFRANRVCLLKLYMLVKSARTVSHELYREKRVYIALTSYG